MNKIITNSIIKTSLILSFLGIILTVTGCNDSKIHNYREIISTKNIDKIQIKSRNTDDIRNYIDEYTTITNREKNYFIKNLEGRHLQYTKTNNDEATYENNTDIFIITYEDGSKIYLDNCHALKKDKNNKIKFDKKITPYNCVIGQNIIVDETNAEYLFSREDLIQFEKNGYLYDIINKSSISYNKYYYNRFINEYKSNDFYEIYYQNDRIKTVLKSEFTYEGQEIYPILYKGYEYDSTDSTIRKVEQETTYEIYYDYATPIETTKLIRYNLEDSIVVEVNLYTGATREYPLPLR